MGDGIELFSLVSHYVRDVGYTGRFVVGRGRRWSVGCGLHAYDFFVVLKTK